METGNEQETWDPYSILNVTRDATQQEIQESYLRLSKTFHPDRQARCEMSQDLLQASEEEFVRITRAKEILQDVHCREAYDRYGMIGVEMFEKGITNAEIRSWHIGKEYRNETGIKDLLKYYMKREATMELDKMISSFGHIETECDASSLFDEIIDTFTRRQTMKQFFDNCWNGIPQINIVLNESDYPDMSDMSNVSDIMNSSLQDEIEIISNALKTGDVSQLENVNVTRESVKPHLTSFLINLSHQWDIDNENTFVLGASQYLSFEKNEHSKLFHNIESEWHYQHSQNTKFVSGLSFGSSAFGTRLGIQRTINDSTWIDIGLNFNFLDESWKSLINAMAYGKEMDKLESKEQEDAANVIKSMIENDSEFSNSVLNILPELLWLIKSGVGCLYNGLSFMTSNLFEKKGMSLYPGFDIKFSLKKLLFDKWLGTTSIKLGRVPSFDIEMKKNFGLKHWTFGIETSKKSFGLSVKHVSELTSRVRWFIKCNIDLINLLKIEFGLSRTLCDEHLHLSIREMSGMNSNIFYGSNIDVRGVCALSFSFTQGLYFHLRAARGPSQFNVPILLSQSVKPRHLISSFIMPFCLILGYKHYLEKKEYRKKMKSINDQLNLKGLKMESKRQMAENQQKLMNRVSKLNLNNELKKDSNELIVLCAIYGKNIESKIKSSLQKQYFDGDNETENENERKRNEENEFDNENENENENEKEDEKNCLMEFDETDDGRPPPLFFSQNGNNDNQDNNNNNKNNSNNTNNFENRSEQRIYLENIEYIKGCLSDKNYDSSKIIDKLMSKPCIDSQEDMYLPSWIDVTTVLRYMTRDGQLCLSSGTKTSLPGFYDCAPHHYSNKELFIIYQYNGHVYYCCIMDVLPLNLPNSLDLQWIDCRHV